MESIEESKGWKFSSTGTIIACSVALGTLLLSSVIGWNTILFVVSFLSGRGYDGKQ